MDHGHLGDGTFQSASIVGLDDATLFGRPELLEGKIEDSYAENSFIAVYDSKFSKLENPRIGAEFELNDHRGRTSGIARVTSSGLFGIPTLYTTYFRALQHIPNPRFTISYVLVEPKSALAKLGYRALTSDEFVQKSRISTSTRRASA